MEGGDEKEPVVFQETWGNCPVECVSWNDCQKFIRKLSSMFSGGNFRLPTEAEWEDACRAETPGIYAGDVLAMGWCAINSGNKTLDLEALWDEVKGDGGDTKEQARRIRDNGCRTHPVANKKPNAWGLYDIHGNVWKWCKDFFGDYASESVTDPTGPSEGSNRVVRGGSWNNDAVITCASPIASLWTHTITTKTWAWS